MGRAFACAACTPSCRITAPAALFDAEVGEENAKGQSTIKLRLKDGAKVATNKSYKIKLAMTLEGDIPVSTNELTVRISAGNLKLKAEPASQSFFQSQNRYREVSYKLSVTAPEGARIGRVELGSVGILRRTLVNADTNVIPEISQDGKSVTVRVILKDTSTLSAGKNYTLPLEVYAKGNVENPKPVKINLSLKVLK